MSRHEILGALSAHLQLGACRMAQLLYILSTTGVEQLYSNCRAMCGKGAPAWQNSASTALHVLYNWCSAIV